MFTLSFISSGDTALNSTMLSPCISLFGTSVIKSDTECQIISSRARFNTLLSTVSTDVARASTKKGEWRSAESKLSYLIFISVLNSAMGVRFNLASVTIPSEPSDPVISLLISKVCKSSLSTCSRS